MEIDLARAGNDLGAVSRRLRSQVCIVGGGIAGLVLANLLKNTCTVTLLEAGGKTPELSLGSDPFGAKLAGALHAGTAEGRVRAFGGCSLTWGGQLLGMPEDAGWPVPAATWERGSRLWHLPEDAAAFLAENGHALPPLLAALRGFTPRLSRFVPFSHRNLANKPGRELLASRNVRVALRAQATELLLSETRDRITAVTVRTPSGRSLRVVADRFILAAGTVETCRLLLASRSVIPEGVGNGYGQVGVNFHDHLTVSAAVFTGAARARMLAEFRPWMLTPKKQRRSLYSLKLEPSAELRREAGLLPGMAHLTVTEPESSGVGAVRQLLRAGQQGKMARTAFGIPALLPRVAGQLARLAWEARTKQRRYVSPDATVHLQLNVAQESPTASRVRLAAEVDAAGMPKAVVDWEVSGAELGALRRFAEAIRAGLERAGVGDGVAWEPSLFGDGRDADRELLRTLDDARHAMGGACMGTDPARSVVDPDLRVHGVANLFVASAAVFPDGAPQLPTLALSALCYRLAELLEAELAR